MDPNETLKLIREAVSRVQASRSWDMDCAELGDRLANLVEDLDEWLSNGGFLPSEWSK